MILAILHKIASDLGTPNTLYRLLSCTPRVKREESKLGGLTIYPRVANFLQCICVKNYENWLAVGLDKVSLLQKLSGLLFWPTL